MRIRRLLQPSIPGDKPPRRSRREMAMMAAAIIAGGIGLSWLTIRVTHPSRGAQPGKTDENLLIRSEVIAIFASPALVEWARGLSDPGALESDDEIKGGLQRGGLEKAWYAIHYREFESDGNRPVMTIYTRPFETSAKAFEFRAVVATIRGHPPSYPSVDYSEATIRPIPEDLAEAEPGEAIAELMLRWELEESRKGH